MAAIAAGVAIAATAASTAMKASAGGTETSTNPAYSPKTMKEKLLGKEVRSLISSESDLMSNAMGQFSNLSPELYAAALGMVPQYEDNSADLSAASQARDAIQAEVQQIQDALGMSKKERKAAGLPGNPEKLRKQLKLAQRNLTNATNRFRDLEAMPKRITGFEKASPDMLPADSPLSSQNPYNQIRSTTNEGLLAALRGEAPVDQTLTNQWNEAEDQLREKLRRQLGPDYETSTAGIQAIANFEREKSESFQAYNRQTILDYSALSIQNEQLNQAMLQGILERGTYLPTTQMALAGQLNQPVQAGLGLLDYYQTGRRQDTQTTQKQPSKWADALGQAGSGLMSASLGAGGGGATGAGDPSSPSFVGPPAPSEPYGIRSLASDVWGGLKGAGTAVGNFLRY